MKQDRLQFGSSPRLRGTRRRHDGRGQQRRFIPAPAGNTYFAAANDCGCAVHPRACGEHIAQLVRSEVETGSSPRLRGTRH